MPALLDAQALHDQLALHGLIIPSGLPGAYGRGAAFEHVIERFDALVMRSDEGILGIGIRIAMRLQWAVKELHLPSPWLYLTGALLACAAGIGATLAMRGHGPVLAGVSGLLVYAGACVLTGAVDKPFLHDLRTGLTLLSNRRLAR